MSRYGGQQSHDFGYGDRYDRLTNYGNTRSQSSAAPRPPSDNMYDDHYGRGGQQDRMNERRRSGGQRNMPREMHHPYRGRDDRRSGGFRGGNAPSDAGGLLGASPNEPANSSSGMMGSNSTQQQLAAAMQAQQTQNLLAILQAQQLSSMNSGSLLPTPPGMGQRGKVGGRQFNERNRPPNQQMFQKRRGLMQDQGPGMKRRRDDRNRPPPRNQQNQSNRQQRPNVNREQQRQHQQKAKKIEGEADDVFEMKEDGQVEAKLDDLEISEIPEELISKIEELRKRTKIDRNIADQDVDKLAAFHFDGQKYRCELCKVVAQKYKSIKQHFMGKKHSFNVVEARQAGNDVDRDIMDIMLHPENWLELNPCAKKILQKQAIGFLEAKKKEEEEFKIKHPENFVVYRMDTRKSAIKSDDSVVIRHVCESVVSIKDFAGDKQLFGCEFIKAASGFDCRLCNDVLTSGASVVEHIRTEKHIKAYQKYLEEHNGYHDDVVQRNKDIVNVLEQQHGKEVILYEAFEEENDRQEKISRRYIIVDDPEFVRIEKPVAGWPSTDDVAEGEEVVEEEDFQKGEGFDADAEGVLDEDLLEGGDDYNEDELNGEEEQLLDDEPAQGDITGEVEMENEIKEEKEEELYEPSEPIVDGDGDAAASQEEKPIEEPIEEIIEEPVEAPVTPKKPVSTVKAVKQSQPPLAIRGHRGRRGSQRGAARGSTRTPRGTSRSQQRQTRTPKEQDEKFEVIDELGAD